MDTREKEIRKATIQVLIGRLGICGDYRLKKELTEELIDILEGDDG